MSFGLIGRTAGEGGGGGANLNGVRSTSGTGAKIARGVYFKVVLFSGVLSDGEDTKGDLNCGNFTGELRDRGIAADLFNGMVEGNASISLLSSSSSSSLLLLSG